MSATHHTYEHPLRHRLFVGTEVLVSGLAFLAIGLLATGAFFAYGLFSNVTELELKKAPGFTPASSVLEPDKEPSSELQAILENYAADLPTEAGIVVHNLKTSEHGEINSHKPFVTASMYKLFVAHEVLRHIEAGEITFTEAAGNDTAMNVRECFRKMITVSDNACGIALGRKIGFEQVNPQLKAVGFDETDLTRYQMETTADDIYVFFSHVHNQITLEKDSQRFLLDQLLAQRVNDRFSQGLPPGTEFAHKTGSLYGRFHDGGIVYSHGNYIIVMLAGPWDSLGQARTHFAELANTVDDYFAENN